jgi:phosphoribosylformimino-5-aminoimidazole carboxamide ribotide isomerase
MLIPCIDLQGGQAVQLVHGRRRELAVADVFGLLDRFDGYRWLHLIDLDAAMHRGQNNLLVKQLCVRAQREHSMKVRVGGGIRTIRRAAELVEVGVTHVIVGSAAFRRNQPNFRYLEQLAKGIGKKHVIIALDTAKGRIVVGGWRESLSISPIDVMPSLEPFCAGFLCTDVDREGTMCGANLKWFAGLAKATKLPVIAAGGISTMREIRQLERWGMDAAVGMALYKNRVR